MHPILEELYSIEEQNQMHNAEVEKIERKTRFWGWCSIIILIIALIEIFGNVKIFPF